MPELVSPIQELLDETKLTAKDINKVNKSAFYNYFPVYKKQLTFQSSKIYLNRICAFFLTYATISNDLVVRPLSVQN